MKQSKDNKIYLVKKGHSFSFFRNIFLNPHNQTEKELEQIKEHEKVHVNHYHSMDALLIHLVIIFQWFNPFAWLLKYAIYENHEFIADRETSRKVSEYKYQDLLLRQAAGIPLSTLVHPFNQISLKRRFKMLLKNQSPNRNLWKYLAYMPVVLIAFYFVSCDNTSNDETTADPKQIIEGEKLNGEPIFTYADQQPVFPGGEEARIAYLQENLTYPEELRADSISGTVYISFVIDKNGKVHKSQILRGVHEELDAITQEVVENMPDWEPAMHNGEPVNVKFNMPVRFTVE
ncbi:MAG: M56 family metallopeptidase [Bacteroidales bacterium]|nr:M56 family metallopeptidase [Bacteroidales bacterium]